MSRPALLALLGVLAGSFAFHAYRAEHPTTSYQSADERSYGKLAVGIADKRTYGNGLKDPLHWPPGAPVLFAAALVVTERAVEKHVTSIFTKLDLTPASEDHRRVLAVLRYLQSS